MTNQKSWSFTLKENERMKRRAFFSVVIILGVTPLPLSVIAQTWWDSNWQFRRSLTIDNTGNPDPLTDYQVRVNVTYDSDMQSDFDDLRFTDNDNATELLHWRENLAVSDSAIFWIKVPSIPAYSTTTIYMYYGNPSASSAGNFDDTFTKDYGDSGLAGWWHMDEGSGTTAADGSGNGNTGMLYDDVTWTPVDGGQWDGRSDVNFSTGSALQFDGSGDYVRFGTSGFNAHLGSVELWAKPESLPSARAYIFCHRVGTSTTRIYLYNKKSGDFYFAIGNKFDQDSGADFALNQWYHLVLTWNYGAYYVYMNGEEVKQGTYNDFSNIDPNAYLASYKGSQEWWNGLIDEVRVYNRVLSSGEIRAHYERRKYTFPEPDILVGSEETVDSDGDGIPDENDNCPLVF
ncbi:MAG: DUF2341 domain-containing protein, partial [bacterium]